MSCPTSQNGIFLGDYARAKKALEEERRILRLQQVRSESKNLARKLRNDVCAEKQKQLRNLQAIKEQELELWRRSVLIQKYDDYRSAVFHVGDAHAAALAEYENKPKTQESLFRRQVRSRRSYNKYDPSAFNKLKIDKEDIGKNGTKSLHPRQNISACTQTINNKNHNKNSTTAAVQVDEESLNNNSNNRKRHRSENRKDFGTQHDSLDSERSEELDSCQKSHCSISDYEQEDRIINKLKQTPAVVLEVENEHLFGKEKQKPNEVKDNFVQNNRQFCNVVSDNKQTKPTANEEPKTSEPRFTQVSKLIQKQKSAAAESRKLKIPPYKSVESAHEVKTIRAPIPPPKTMETEASRPPIKTHNSQLVQPSRNASVIANNYITSALKNLIEKEDGMPRTNIPVPSPAKKGRETLPMTKLQLYSEDASLLQRFNIAKDSSAKKSSKKLSATQEQLQKITDEQNKVSQDVQRLTEKLAIISRDCCNDNLPQETGVTYRKVNVKAATPPQTPKKKPDLIDRASSAPTSPVARTKVDRACSPNVNTTEINTTTTAVEINMVETVDRGSSPLVLQQTDIEASPTPETADTKIDISYVKSSSKHAEKMKSTKELPVVHYKKEKIIKAVVQKTAQIRKNRTDMEESSTYSLALLDFASDQSKMLCNDLNKEVRKKNPSKTVCTKLENLLTYNEKLRKNLIEQLERNRVLKFTEADNENVKMIISEMCAVRNEREKLFKNAVLDLQTAEKLEEEEKLPEAQQHKASEEEAKVVDKQQNEPVEIIITVRGAKPLEGSLFNKPEPVKLTLGISDSQRVQEKVQTNDVTPTRKINTVESAQAQKKDILYDSESTHYKSLPKQMNSTMHSCSDEQTLGNIDSPEEETNIEDQLPQDAQEAACKAHIDPIVKQYVDRLLSMRRSSVRALGLSTTEVETPTNSIINTTSNQMQTTDELNNSKKYFESAERFIAENYKYLEQLEQSLADKKNISAEKSMQIVEDLWRQHFQQESMKHSTAKKNKSTSEKKDDVKTPKFNMVEIAKETVRNVMLQMTQSASKQSAQKSNTKTQTIVKKTKTTTTSKESKPMDDDFIFKRPLPKSNKKAKINKVQNDDSITLKSAKKTAENTKKVESTENKDNSYGAEMKRKSQTKLSTTDELDDENRIHFTDLAKNCSARIDEINKMITRVREEKERLVMSTYSSLSLTTAEPTPISTKVSDKSQEEEEDELNSISLHALPDRHAALTGSHDSGIGQSRPATRQDALVEEQKSTSMELSATTGQSNAKHSKPPATLKRFSPQLNEELAIHELSTIVEVDTPITSRLQTARSEVDTAFELYLQENNVDLTMLTPEQHKKLEEVFAEIVNVVRNQESEINYTEFPSLNSYLKRVSNGKVAETSVAFSDDSQQGVDSRVKEMIKCMRLSTLSINSFPSPNEYARRMHKDSTFLELIDTESLENISEDASSASDSDSMNIEEELRKRNLLVESFKTQSPNTKLDEKCVAEISVSSNKSKKSTDLGTGGWASTMIRRMQETNALSSGTSPTPEKKTKSHNKARNEKIQINLTAVNSSTPSAGDDTTIDGLGGREMNLREFLQRELSRYDHTTTASTSSTAPSLNDSLRHQFYNSIMDSLTPKTQGSSNKGVQATQASKNQHDNTIQGLSSSLSDNLPNNGTPSYMARQKTSTPVQSSRSHTQDSRSSTTSTLFSCESHVSSVPLPKKHAPQKHTQT